MEAVTNKRFIHLFIYIQMRKKYEFHREMGQVYLDLNQNISAWTETRW